MQKNYNPKDFEERIYKMWMEKGHFKARVNEDKEPFTIVLPPPNITGRLHEGHALNHTLQDILIRTKRMQGYETLWLPGTDHASIATEVKILDMINKNEGRTKQDLTREEFLEYAWKWKEEYGGSIVSQMKKLGNSCDWDKERFTMDEGCNKAVKEVFIKMYEEGLIYRGNRIINWCPDCRTSLSDAEVDHALENGNFYHINYPIEGMDESLEIATTRPETMLGDTAVAVNPNDSRYKHLIGKNAVLPLVGKVIPIIGDDYVDLETGTGALKVTPSHDPNDYEIGKRHNLEFINIFTDDAKINKRGGKYEGLDRQEARKQIVEDLKKEGFLVNIKKHDHNVGHCYRCDTAIEPRISDQWFVDMKPLAEPAIKSVLDGDMKFVPEKYTKTYMNWLENIRDWCISRQLWWGHRIPAYYCDECGHINVSREEVKVCEKCSCNNVRQDEDVLDTWFSSALWPFSTLGWPDKTKELEYFYPTDVLVTGYDIIFFWVARMMFSGLKEMKVAPFHTTLINGIVRDKYGRKVSKSLGNGTDPIDIIDEYGADALRFMLVNGISAGSDTRFSIEKVESARNFANKLWNASRFVLSNLDDSKPEIDYEKLDTADIWILGELDKTTENVTKLIEKYELGMASNEVVEFVWNKYCDWYIELSKHGVYSDDKTVKNQKMAILVTVLKDMLKLLHPFMPFITEEIYQAIPGIQTDLIVAEWPKSRNIDTTGNMMEDIMEAIRKIRNLRAEMEIPMSKKSRLFIEASDSYATRIIDNADYFYRLSGITEVIKTEGEVDNSASIILDSMTLSLPLDDLIDYKKELERLEGEIKEVTSEIKRAEGKLANEGFTNKAPEKLVNAEREKLAKYQEMLNELNEKVLVVRTKV